MQVSFNWLKEFVDIAISPLELAEVMTGAGVTVEHVEATNKGVEKVVVAKVLSKEKHPDAEKLSLCQVTTDGENTIQVVCGAPNVAAGLVVPFAMIGAKLPGGLNISATKLRGVASNGMICSAKELGIDPEKCPPEQKEGILILPEDTPLGQEITQFLGLDDYILELDLTPNRSDCLSVLNIAREIGALLKQPVRIPELTKLPVEQRIQDLAEVEIQAPDLCHRYTASMVRGVKVAPSPFWMQHRLQCAGIRPINNIVDITNYILMELGQPLHAFDYDQIAGHKITVRRGEQDETIVTLDGNKRTLTSDMLLICDQARPVGVAGVMGGENTEVTAETQNVFIEAAYFLPTSVRRTATKLGLRSEASIRFEKGINMDTVALAAQRAAQLMQALGGGVVVGGIIDQYPTPHQAPVITLPLAKVNAVLGTKIDDQTIKDVLLSLNFELIASTNEAIQVRVPAYRPDVTIAEDLIEEVARVYGYNNIPETLPNGASGRGQLTSGQKIRDQMINKLVALGLNEVVNYSFINKNNDDKLNLPLDDLRRKSVAVLNPLSEEQGHMRTSMLSGLLSTMTSNINRRNEDIAIFEMGKVYLLDGELTPENLAREKWVLGLGLRGKTDFTWQGGGESYDFYYLKGIVEGLVAELKIKDAIYKPCKDSSIYHPGRSAYLMVDDQVVGIFGELHPQIADNYDLSGRYYMGEIEVEKLIAHGVGKTLVKHLPKFPSVTRDLAVVVSEEVSSAQLSACIQDAAGALLVDVKLFDVYQGDQIKAGEKSMAFALIFQADDRTLTDIEVNAEYEKIYETLRNQYGAVLRA